MTREQSAFIRTISWDPFHGDIADRFQKLGQIAERVIPRENFDYYGLKSPALYHNGVFGGGRLDNVPHRDVFTQRLGELTVRLLKRLTWQLAKRKAA